MECDEYKEQASLFIDGALAASKQPGLFQHLAECSDCQSFMQVSLRVRQEAAEEKVTVPASIDEEVLSAFGSRYTGRKESRRQPWRVPSLSFWHRRLVVPFPAVAFALLLIVLLATAVSISAFRGQGSAPGVSFITARGEATVPPGSVVVIYSLPEQEVVGRPVRNQQPLERSF